MPTVRRNTVSTFRLEVYTRQSRNIFTLTTVRTSNLAQNHSHKSQSSVTDFNPRIRKYETEFLSIWPQILVAKGKVKVNFAYAQTPHPSNVCRSGYAVPKVSGNPLFFRGPNPGTDGFQDWMGFTAGRFQHQIVYYTALLEAQANEATAVPHVYTKLPRLTV
jgi:hypothetical protein